MIVYRRVKNLDPDMKSYYNNSRARSSSICEDCRHFLEVDHGRPACRLLLDAFGRTPLPCQYARMLRGEIPPPAGCPLTQS